MKEPTYDPVLDADFLRASAYAERQIGAMYGIEDHRYESKSLLKHRIHELKEEVEELRRKLTAADIDTSIAEFNKLQAEVTLAQTIRASSILTWCTILTWAASVGFLFLDYSWGRWLWGAIAGITTAYRVFSLIWPEKYDNLNVMARRLDVNKAQLDVNKAYKLSELGHVA